MSESKHGTLGEISWKLLVHGRVQVDQLRMLWDRVTKAMRAEDHETREFADMLASDEGKLVWTDIHLDDMTTQQYKLLVACSCVPRVRDEILGSLHADGHEHRVMALHVAIAGAFPACFDAFLCGRPNLLVNRYTPVSESKDLLKQRVFRGLHDFVAAMLCVIRHGDLPRDVGDLATLIAASRKNASIVRLSALNDLPRNPAPRSARPRPLSTSSR